MPNENNIATSPIKLLRDGSYCRIWLTGVFSNTMRWLEMLAVGVYVFDKTESPLIVSIIIFFRMAPMILFGAMLGALAERTNKKHLMLYGLAPVIFASIMMGILLFTGKAELWHIALAGFLNGTFFAMDFPVRRNILGEICGPNRVGSGMALDATTNASTKLVGPILGGIILEIVGLHGAFFLSAAFHIFAFFSVAGLTYIPNTIAQTKKNVFSQIKEGVRYIKSDRVILALLGITVLINLLALPFASMVPVIGKAELGLSASLVGILASAEGAGTLIGCFVIAMFKIKQFTQIFFFGSIFFLILLVLFSLSSWYTLSLVILFLAGIAHAGFTVGQSTLIFTKPTPEVRGRVMGLLSMCIGLQPIGVLHIGFLANYFGGSNAILIMTLEGLIGIGICWMLWPEMRK